MEGIITFVIAILVVFGIMYLVFSVFQKYAGVTFSSRWDYSKNVKNNTEYSNMLAESQNKLKKRNPALYQKAVENLKKKRYANTYNNLEDEIEKIKKTNPEWTKRESEKQGKIIVKEYEERIEKAKLKYNIQEFNRDLIDNPKYKLFVETHRKFYIKKEKLDSNDVEIFKSEDYKEWEKLYYEEKEKHNFVDKIKYYNEVFKSPL